MEACRLTDLILIVGTCASGKTTLARGLQAAGFNALAFALEHSYSPPCMAEAESPPIGRFVLHVRYTGRATQCKVA